MNYQWVGKKRSIYIQGEQLTNGSRAILPSSGLSSRVKTWFKTSSAIRSVIVESCNSGISNRYILVVVEVMVVGMVGVIVVGSVEGNTADSG